MFTSNNPTDLRRHSVVPSMTIGYDQSHILDNIADTKSAENQERSFVEIPIDIPLNTNKQLDLIASKVNETIKNISSTYNEIGYTTEEIAEKKTEIFDAINNTIATFEGNLQREKNSITNECEWLRQQIRVILAMLDDSRGEKHLKLSSRGIVFDDDFMYTQGCNEEVLHHMRKQQQNKEFSLSNGSFPFLEDDHMSPTDMHFSNTLGLGSPFKYSSLNSCNPNTGSFGSFRRNSSDLSSQTTGVPHQAQTSQQQPKMSLMQYKSRLNSIFLEVLKDFVKVFKKFNEVNRLLWESIETITDDYKEQSHAALMEMLPTKANADEHAELLSDFERVIEDLKLINRNYNPELRQGMSGSSAEGVAFIISSPRKKRQSVPAGSEAGEHCEDGMDRLRQVNYSLVHAIRELKVTKITNETVAQITQTIEFTEREIEARSTKMKQNISQCLSLIHALSLSDSDLIAIQRMQNQANGNESEANPGEGLLDIGTLKFIQTNPRELGLKDIHLGFVAKLTHTLESIRDNKQKRWDQFSRACQNLWEKLGENQSYTSSFLEANSSLTDISLSNFKMELKRLYTKRAEYVDSFILDARKQIADLHVKLLYSASRCKEFKYHDFDVNENRGDKEEILYEHEAEIERLKTEYTVREPVLTLFAQLKELLEDQKFLAESSKDSSRLLSKNSCKILLNEEKLRKKIHRNMPKTLASLKQEIIGFNNRSLAQGHLPITAGNDDMFEKVLMIEADLNISGTKPARAKAGVVPAPRAPPPKKMNTSPTRVVKPLHRRSPTLAGSLQNRKGPQLSGIRSRFSPKEKTNVFTNRQSPQGGRSFNTTRTIRPASGAILVPLKTSLEATGAMEASGQSHGRPSPVNRTDSVTSDDTLYSVCSRVSPLRASNNISSFSNNSSPWKQIRRSPEAPSNDKENSIMECDAVFGGPFVTSPETAKRSEQITRLSVGSNSCSTIVGDDYQKWREDRIRQINGQDINLC